MAIEDLLNRDDVPDDLREAIQREAAERKRDEGALRESERRYRNVVEDQTEFIVRWLPDTTRTFVNDSYCRYFGLDRDEAIGTKFLPLVSEEFQEAVRARIGALTPENPVSRGEHRVVLPDGSVGWNAWTDRALFDEEGRLVELQSVGRDITERKRAESALRESEQRLSAFLDAASDAFYLLDSEMRFVEINRKGLDIIGKSREAVIGKHLSEIVPDVVDSGRYQAHLEVLRTGEPFVVEDFVPHPVFGDRHFILKSFKVGDGLGVIASDITDLKRAEEERRNLEARVHHAQKLEGLGSLAGGVAHDFNNLLVGVLGHAELALSNLPPESPVRSNVQRIMQAAERARDLSRQMLAAAGRSQFELRATDLNDIVTETLHLLQAAVAKSIRLSARLSDKPALIQADLSQMQQVIMNLVINAAEAIGDRPGMVAIATGFETLSGDEKRYSRFTGAELDARSHVLLEVRDDGPGIDDRTLSKVFDPFFTTKSVGHGLGLSALLGIVKGHRGGIEVQSEPGKGTTFRLVFPATQEVPQKARSTAAEGRLEGTVLVIDDEEIVRVMVSEMLRPHGLEVLTAESGAAGVALYEQKHTQIGLILLDLSMPGMGGEETFQRLRDVSLEVPVILSSGFSEEETMRRFEGRGLTGFIQKPYRLAALLAEVRRCLGQRSAAT